MPVGCSYSNRRYGDDGGDYGTAHWNTNSKGTNSQKTNDGGANVAMFTPVATYNLKPTSMPAVPGCAILTAPLF